MGIKSAETELIAEESALKVHEWSLPFTVSGVAIITKQEM